jgi:uncharacterized protein
LSGSAGGPPAEWADGGTSRPRSQYRQQGCVALAADDVSRVKPKRDEVIVRHNEAAHRFETEVDGKLSIADYVRRDREMIMTHTFVPPELRGCGIAEKLVKAALEHARTEKLRVVPACSYVDAFIQRHSEYRTLLN